MQTLYLHPQNPQPRLLKQIANALNDAQLIIYPTQMGYAILSHMNAKNNLHKISTIHQIINTTHHTLLCRSLSEAAQYADINNQQFKIIKNQSNDIARFILSPTKQTPKYLNTKNAIGIHITNHPLTNALIDLLETPVVIHELHHEIIDTTTTYEIQENLSQHIDILVDAGTINPSPLSTKNLIE
ncbi:Sua5/YciO/YrdC/YwlC family protein [Moraxella oculi]|uniref:Sua5/YciO/YrdC/YwlC family protein n=1 Tax=Moraxella oculi TaxID=2940516 RepID=A0ABW8U5K5_9GAMM